MKASGIIELTLNLANFLRHLLLLDKFLVIHILIKGCKNSQFSERLTVVIVINDHHKLFGIL